MSQKYDKVNMSRILEDHQKWYHFEQMIRHIKGHVEWELVDARFSEPERDMLLISAMFEPYSFTHHLYREQYSTDK